MNSAPVPLFPATAWSVIRAAQDRGSPEYLAATNRCIAAYWRPIFYFLRAKGYALEQAEDLTQEFFLRFFQRNWICTADPKRGRFRTFLLTILVRFLSDQGPGRAPRQKVFDQRMVTISALMGDPERTFQPCDKRTPEEIFMREWAHAVIGSVQRRLENWCDAHGRPDWYHLFCETYFPAPGHPRITQQALAERLEVTRDQVRYGLQEVNRQFIEFLRAEVADQLGPEDDLDTEIRELEALLSGE